MSLRMLIPTFCRYSRQTKNTHLTISYVSPSNGLKGFPTRCKFDAVDDTAKAATYYKRNQQHISHPSKIRSITRNVGMSCLYDPWIVLWRVIRDFKIYDAVARRRGLQNKIIICARQSEWIIFSPKSILNTVLVL